MSHLSGRGCWSTLVIWYGLLGMALGGWDYGVVEDEVIGVWMLAI